MKRRLISTPAAPLAAALLLGGVAGNEDARADTAAAAVPAPPRAMTPMPEDTERLALDYAVYVGGFRLVDIAFDARLADGAYRMTMDLKSEGMLTWMIDWSMSAYSEGKREDGTIVPVRAGHDSRWNGKKRWIRMDFPDGGAPTARTMPPVDETAQARKVSLRDRLGARDLAGGVLSTLLSTGATDSCTHSEPVFDGKRRYNLVFRELGRETLSPSDYSPFGGETVRCAMSIERIAGFREGGSRYRWMSDGTAVVWVGRPFPDAPPMPVRLQIDTSFGPLFAHLKGAARHRDGTVTRLSAAR